jgi:hypothetical protein
MPAARLRRELSSYCVAFEQQGQERFFLKPLLTLSFSLPKNKKCFPRFQPPIAVFGSACCAFERTLRSAPGNRESTFLPTF